MDKFSSSERASVATENVLGPKAPCTYELLPVQVVVSAMNLPSVNDEDWLSIQQALSELNCKRTRLYHHMNCGAIQAVKDGRRTFITRGEIRRFKNKQPSYLSTKPPSWIGTPCHANIQIAIANSCLQSPESASTF